VVVPCLNEAPHLAGLLERLAADAGRDDRIVVVDGGSRDGSQGIVASVSNHEPRIRLLHNPDRLQSAGINAAVVTYGEGCRYVARIDAHADYPAQYVRRLIEVAERTQAASVVVPMVTRGKGCFQRAAAAAQNSKIGTGGAAHRQGGVSGWVDHGHHALFSLAAYTAVGGYDGAFSHNEDAELDLRLNAAGHRIWMAGDLAIGYHPRANARALFRQYRNYGRGRAMTVRRHHVPLKPRQAAPLAVAPVVLLAAVGLGLSFVHPLWLLATTPALLWALVCTLAGAAAGRAEPGLCPKAAGIAAMVMHLGWSLGFWGQIWRRPPQPRLLSLVTGPQIAR
jgi:succinoglycan biosynthesis protein ExoA